MNTKESPKRLSLFKFKHMKGLIEALRPKTLTASMMPVIVGSAITGLSFNQINFSLFFSLLFTAIFIQIGTNLVNDAFDFENKADTEERLGPKRLIQQDLYSSRQVFCAGMIAFGFATFAAMPMIISGGIVFAVILGLSILSGYAYTGGPYPIAYRGLGEIFVLVFFGWVLTASATYLQLKELSLAPFIAGTQMGLFSMVLIAINNLRDIHQDKKADKRTMTVLLGEKFGRLEIALFALIPFALNFFWIYERGWLFFIPLITLPMAINLIRNIYSFIPGQIYNRFLQQAAILHIAFGSLLALAAIFS